MDSAILGTPDGGCIGDVIHKSKLITTELSQEKVRINTRRKAVSESKVEEFYDFVETTLNSHWSYKWKGIFSSLLTWQNQNMVSFWDRPEEKCKIWHKVALSVEYTIYW